MGKTIRHLSFAGLLASISFMIASCSSKIEFNDYIDKNKPFSLNIGSSDSIQGLDDIKRIEIAVDSEKHREFLKWTARNSEGWTSSLLTYLPTILLTQNNFQLIYDPTNGLVVINFTDKQNQPREYTKTVQPGELNFILK